MTIGSMSDLKDTPFWKKGRSFLIRRTAKVVRAIVRPRKRALPPMNLRKKKRKEWTLGRRRRRSAD